ncbi:MAG: alkaline phosphatase family protein, partial [Anaerolineaceae bacterium]|nr:alkaline phosphatase family protein [Anaerolineaceae bacterium]
MAKKNYSRIPVFIFVVIGFSLVINSCTSNPSGVSPLPGASAAACRGAQCTTADPAASDTPAVPITGPALPTLPVRLPTPGLPNFSHIIVILLENHDYSAVVGNTQQMPNFNRWIDQYTLLTQYYAVSHPSLPNYLALIGGDTFGIQSDCSDCFVNAPSLPDQIEASQRTWKTYQEDMPSACFTGSSGQYAQRHNPFIYFDPIRKDTTRCKSHIVPATELDSDLKSGNLPNFAFIAPNVCNDGHDCTLSQTDDWLGVTIEKIQSSPAYDQATLITVVFDEGTTHAFCCGQGKNGGGHVAALLISKVVKSGFQDDTSYSHYSLLKTIEAAWGLPDL